MKKTQRTGKAFRIKWLVLALAAMALILMPAASQKVSASKLVYTVKFNNNSGTSKSKTYTSLTRNVTLNTTIKLPSVPKAVGYQNLGWTTQKGSTKVVYKAGASVKVKKDMTLYAVRRKSKYYTVSFYLGNGSTNAAYKKLTKSVEEGTYYTLPSVQNWLCKPGMVHNQEWQVFHRKKSRNKDQDSRQHQILCSADAVSQCKSLQGKRNRMEDGNAWKRRIPEASFRIQCIRIYVYGMVED